MKVCQRETKEQTKVKHSFNVFQSTLAFFFFLTDKKHKAEKDLIYLAL